MESPLPYHQDPARRIRTQIFRRVSKACERCRNRKAKCVPGPNGICGACEKGGYTDCFTRNQPRRKRPRPGIEPEPEEILPVPLPRPPPPPTTPPSPPPRAPTPEPEPYVDPLDLIDTLNPPSVLTLPSTYEGSTQSIDFFPPNVTSYVSGAAGPLAEVEELLISWCADNGVSPDGLLISSPLRPSTIHGKPLPEGPLRRAMEDDLIRRFDALQGVDHLKTIDKSGIPTLYAKYRVLPNTVSADQRALLQAAFCLGCCSGSRPHEGGSMVEEAVTYFHLAVESIREWARPSLSSIWALTILVPYAYRMRDPADTQSLLQQMAWHVVELGLHKQETANLYTPEENVGLIFSNYLHSDILCAIMTDLRPTIPLADIDVAASFTGSANSHHLFRASSDTADFMRDYWDPSIDTTSSSYVDSAESKWRQRLHDFRRRADCPTPNVVAWVEFRYHWLRILLHVPLLRHRPSSYAVVSRAVSQILHGHIQVAEANLLEQAWPQLQRLVICGQLLLLCESQVEIHPLEKTQLWDIVFAMLEKLSPQWPKCDEYARAFRAVLDSSGLYAPPTGPLPLTSANPFDVGFDVDSLAIWWLMMGADS